MPFLINPSIQDFLINPSIQDFLINPSMQRPASKTSAPTAGAVITYLIGRKKEHYLDLLDSLP